MARLSAIIALYCIVACAQAESEFDDFPAAKSVLASESHDGVAEHAAPQADAKIVSAAETDTAAAVPPPITARRVPKSWVLESSVVVAVLACIFRYITGSRQNRAVVGAVDAGLAPVLQAQFATATAGATLTPDGSAGTTVGAFAWQEVSACEYRLWASGRQHCHGLLVELALPRRQDLVGSLAEALAPSLLPALPGPTRPTGTALGSDVLTIEVPLAPSLVEPFVFAIMQVKDKKAIVGVAEGASTSIFQPPPLDEGRKDLRRFPSRPAAGPSLQLPDTFTALTEHRDSAEAVTTNELKRFINEYKRGFKLLHITDQAQMAEMKTAEMSTKVLRVVFELPAADKIQAAVTDLMRVVLQLVDFLAVAKFSKDVKERVKDARKAVDAEAEKAAAREAEIARRAKAEAERRAELKRRDELDRETRRKLEEKERKRALEKHLPKMKFKGV